MLTLVQHPWRLGDRRSRPASAHEP